MTMEYGYVDVTHLPEPPPEAPPEAEDLGELWMDEGGSD